jgi:hypothetical protein
MVALAEGRETFVGHAGNRQGAGVHERLKIRKMTINVGPMPQQTFNFTIEKLGDSRGHCDCCGRDSRSVWGLVNEGEATVAAYWMRWTEGHLDEVGANLDMVLGRWGEGATPKDRFAVALVHRNQDDGTPSLMVIDAPGRPVADGALAALGLCRDEVIGTPLAPQVFALVDAIYEQDDRFF